MWILESDGEFLQGKRVWLRPGQRYLFGRVKKDGVFQAIDHKGVSRRQCVIEVEKVNPGDGSHLHTRSRITVTDENSKAGTQVDGKLLKEQSEELKGLEHHLRLGRYPHKLTIKWQPVCLSFFLTSKEKKTPDVLRPKRELLEPFDIKTVQPFVSNQTTHVVAVKRNTVPGLQALITGKYIVDHSYIDALVFATTPEDLEGDENLSPLEKDFDAAWPDPRQYLPPKGKEPTDKPSESYAPDSSREKVFEGWTFVFLDAGQHEILLPAITTGHGKALLYNLDLGKTTADNVVTYMRNAAGEKGFASFNQSPDNGGVIMVNPTLKGEWSKWCDELVNEVALKLDQKYIDQAEFLDAILANDASSLRKSVPYESVDERVDERVAPPVAETKAPPSSSLPQQTQAASQPNGTQPNANGPSHEATQNASPEEEAPPRKRPRKRGPPISRFKAFDDEFDIDAIAPYEPPEESVGSEIYPSQDAGLTPMSMDEPSQISRLHSHVSKRGKSPKDDDAMVDGLLPAAAAMKRRKVEIEQKKKQGQSTEQNAERGKQTMQKPKPKKEIDVLAVARERREAEEAAAKRDQEVLEAKLGDISVEEMKKLAIVEEMEVPTRHDRAIKSNGDASDRWDERWNGRKNFKRFRRKGESGGVPRRPTQNVIVPLVEVKRKNYGIGEAYWSSSHDRDDETRNRNGRRGNVSSQTQTQAQTQTLPEEPTSPTMTRLQQEAAEIVGAIDVDKPRQTRLADKTQQSQQTMNSSRGKRPASFAATGTAKKQRTIRTRAASDSESDEELRFKFGNRKR